MNSGIPGSAFIAMLIDKMTSVILAGQLRTGAFADHENAKNSVKEFLNNHIDKLIQFAEDNPGKRPPIYYHSDTGRVAWLNRKQERGLKRMMAKEARRALG